MTTENTTRFTLSIELGNEAMQSPQDVANALRDAAEQLAQLNDFYSGGIRDANGNTVGDFGIEEGASV